MSDAFFEVANPKYRDVAIYLNELVTEQLFDGQAIKPGKSILSFGEGADGHQLLGIAVRSQGAMLYAGASVLDKHAVLLGKKRTGKTCLRVRKKDEIPADILREIIDVSLKAKQMDYGC